MLNGGLSGCAEGSELLTFLEIGTDMLAIRQDWNKDALAHASVSRSPSQAEESGGHS